MVVNLRFFLTLKGHVVENIEPWNQSIIYLIS